jgi:hypothetical protein
VPAEAGTKERSAGVGRIDLQGFSRLWDSAGAFSGRGSESRAAQGYRPLP